MRVFTAVRHSIAPEHFYGGLWSRNFHPALAQLGHEVIESTVDLLPASRFMQVANNFTNDELRERDRITDEILAEVRREHRRKHVDLFLGYFYNSHFNPDGFAEIRNLGIPTVNFYCNSIYQFDLVSQIAAQVDFAWHAEKDARALYKQIGANPVWVQMGADSEIYRPLPNSVRRSAACFVGQRYADRDRWMATLIQAQVPVAIYGPGWGERQERDARSPMVTRVASRRVYAPGSLPGHMAQVSQNLAREGLVGGTVRTLRQLRYRNETRKLSPTFVPHARGAVPFEALREVFSSHEVILNFSNVWADGRPGSRLIPHVRLRDFEAPMSRTCYLTGFTQELAEFYELGKEVETYQTPEELVDKARYLLAHPAQAERIREAGYLRATHDHTWVRRFEQLFGKIGLK
jgi:spore maturation protein CgeB